MFATRHSRLFILMLILLSLLGCSRTPTRSSQRSSAAEVPPKVTFVELGSVKCIPCIKMQLLMREIEQEYGDQVAILFYDVWTEAGKPYGRQYGIRVIPTQIFLDQNGNEYFRHEGYFPKEDLIQVLRLKGIK